MKEVERVKKQDLRKMVDTAAMMMRKAEEYERKTMELNEVGAQSLAKACWHMEKAALLLVQAAGNEKTD